MLSAKPPPPVPPPVTIASSSEAPSKGKGKEKERPAMPANTTQQVSSKDSFLKVTELSVLQSNGLRFGLKKRKEILPITPSTLSLLSSENMNTSTRPTTPTVVNPELNDQLIKVMEYAQKLKIDMVCLLATYSIHSYIYLIIGRFVHLTPSSTSCSAGDPRRPENHGGLRPGSYRSHRRHQGCKGKQDNRSPDGGS